MDKRVQRALLVATHHREARAPDPGWFRDREEEVRQLGLLLLHCQPPWMVRGLWGRDAGSTVHVGAQVRQSLDEVLGGTPDMVLVALSGHMIDQDDVPALLPGDVPASLAREGALPLAWIGEQLGASAARNVIVIADLVPKDTLRVDAAMVAAALRTPDSALTLITAVNAADRGGPGLTALFTAALQGAAYDRKKGAVTIRRLLEHLQTASAAAGAVSLHAETSMDGDLEFLTPPAPGNVKFFLPTRPLAKPDRQGSADPDADTVLVHSMGPGDYLPGKLRLIQKLGQGGFGAVYEGEQVSLARRVAVKILRSEALGDPELLTMFTREMQAIAALDSPNVVRILQADHAPETGELFYVMDLLKGATLRDLIRQQGRLSPPRAGGLIRDVLAGLSSAHEKGIIHRDIKPENVIVEPEPGGSERAVILDFGVSRILRSVNPTGKVTMVGTPGYIAPEIMAGHRVDQRADLYSAAVMLYELLTGSRPGTTDRDELRQALVDHQAPDDVVRAVLTGLEADPRRRFMSAQVFSDALSGESRPSGRKIQAVTTPFKFFSPFDEEDAAYYFGRDRVITEVMETVLFGRSLVLTGPSGTGKSSMIHAGLLPALRRAGSQPIVVSCREDPLKELVERLAADAPSVKEYAPPTGSKGPPSMSLEEACYQAHRETGKHLVLVLDQAERLFIEGGVDGTRRRALEDALVTIAGSNAPFVAVLLSIREDYLAHLAPLRRSMGLSAGQEVRLGPLPRDACALALVEPLRAREITLEDELLATLLDDLARACREMRIWQEAAAADAVYPPHLQMAASILYEALGPDERTVTMEHYRRAGGLHGILEQHLKYVLDRYLEPDAARVAHKIAQGLVSPARTRLALPEAVVRSRILRDHDSAALETALEVLVELRIVQPVSVRSVRNLELVHDCLVAPILAWTDKTDLQRRSAMESLRVRLFRSRGDRVHHLDREELRDVRRFSGVADSLDEEISHMGEDVRPPLSAKELVARSARRLRLKRGAWIVATVLALAGLVGGTLFRMHILSLQAGNVGRFYMRWQLVEPRGADGELVPVPRADFPDFSWNVYKLADMAKNPVGPTVSADWFSTSTVSEDPDDLSWVERVTASGGQRVIVVAGRHRQGEKPCPPAVIVVEKLPGYDERGETDDPGSAIPLRVPTCRMTRHDNVEIPGGLAWMGTDRDQWHPTYENVLHQVRLEDYRIDRTEVSGQAYLDFVGAIRPFLGRTQQDQLYLDLKSLDDPMDRAHILVEPAMDLSWEEARLYCLWLGKDLPTDAQWVKAGRGGIRLDGDVEVSRRNPSPKRLFPWGDDVDELKRRANCVLQWEANKDEGVEHPRHTYLAVDSKPEGASPYGVLHLSGNALEWIRDYATRTFFEQHPDHIREDPTGPEEGPHRGVRGGHVYSRSVENCSLAYPDRIGPVNRRRGLGFRCAIHGPATTWIEVP